MDENVRIYLPMTQVSKEQIREFDRRMAEQMTNSLVKAAEPCVKYLRRAKRKQTPWERLCGVVRDIEDETHKLEQKHPWAQIFYNWFAAGAIALLIFSLIWWGFSVTASNRAAAEYDAAVQSFYAEQDAKAQAEQEAILAEQQSERARRERDIQLMAKFLEGLSGFVKNRGYTSVDLYTYAQCPINRVLNPAFWCSTLEEALRQEGQWVGFSESNQVTKANLDLARKVVNEWYDGEVRPCGYEYCYTEFTNNGLYLKSDFGPATFNNTWRSTAA